MTACGLRWDYEFQLCADKTVEWTFTIAQAPFDGILIVVVMVIMMTKVMMVVMIHSQADATVVMMMVAADLDRHLC